MKNSILIIESDSEVGILKEVCSVIEELKHTTMRIERRSYIINVTAFESILEREKLCIIDISDRSNDVLIGKLLAYKFPTIFIANTRNDVNPELRNFLILYYNKDSIGQFKINLKNVLDRTIKLIDENKTTITDGIKRIKQKKLFVSYTHNDQNYLNRLLVHLKPLEKNNIIDIWVDKKIQPGKDWKIEIEKSLNAAEVAILLISADYLASDFIVDNELPPILEKVQLDGTTIIPLIIKPCRFLRDEKLNKFQAANDPKYPLSSLSEDQKEVIYDKVSEQVEKMVL